MDELIDALVQSAFGVTAVLTRLAAEHDLSLTQLRVLAILRDREVRMSELAEYLGLERSTMSGLVDRASARGLLRRGPGATDKRVVHVSVTPDGAALVDRLYATVSEQLAPMVGVLTAAEQHRLQVLLERMVSARA